jgi:hypothetical protein
VHDTEQGGHDAPSDRKRWQPYPRRGAL